MLAQDTGANPEAPAGRPAGLQFRDAHAGLVAADAARDRADYAAAVQLYRESAAEYARLSAKYPDWEPGMTRFRRSYCENQLQAAEMRLERVRAEGNAAPPAAGPEPVGDEPAAEEGPGAAAGANPVGDEPAAGEGPGASIAEDRAEVLKQLGDTAADLIRRGKTMEARELLIRGIELNPDHLVTRMLLGIIHSMEGQHDQAVYILRGVAEECPWNARAKILLAAAYFGVGRILSAETELRKALELDSLLPEAHYNLALVLLAMDPPDRETATKSYTRSLELGAPPDPAMEKDLKGN
jgi:Flp pilus assembly protein TadD